MLFLDQYYLTNTFEDYINYIFMLDIVVNFCTAYLDDQGNLITSRKMIFMNYIKTYFVIDLLSSLPFKWFLRSGNNANVLLRILKLPRLIRMAKLNKVSKLGDAFKGTEFSYYLRINGGSLNIIGMIMITVTILHLTSILWCAIGYYSPDFPKT